MRRLSDEALDDLYHDGSHENLQGFNHIRGLRAVADAAVQAYISDQREQDAILRLSGIDPDDARRFLDYMNHKPHCAIRHGLDKCTCEYSLEIKT